MKLLLDEMLSPAIARTLRAHGHDCVSVKEHAEWQGLPDADLVAIARNEQRAIVTTNLRAFRQSFDVGANPVCVRCVCSLKTSWRSAPWS